MAINSVLDYFIQTVGYHLRGDGPLQRRRCKALLRLCPTELEQDGFFFCFFWGGCMEQTTGWRGMSHCKTTSSFAVRFSHAEQESDYMQGVPGVHRGAQSEEAYVGWRTHHRRLLVPVSSG